MKNIYHLIPVNCALSVKPWADEKLIYRMLSFLISTVKLAVVPSIVHVSCVTALLWCKEQCLQCRILIMSLCVLYMSSSLLDGQTSQETSIRVCLVLENGIKPFRMVIWLIISTLRLQNNYGFIHSTSATSPLPFRFVKCHFDESMNASFWFLKQFCISLFNNKGLREKILLDHREVSESLIMWQLPEL